MSAAVVITRMDHTPAEFRALAANSDDADQARRRLGVAMVLDGTLRLDAARQAAMDRQTLRDWGHRLSTQSGGSGVHRHEPPHPTPFFPHPN